MASDIKQRIVLEGEGEYKKALQDASRNLKTLRSELKAETAELGKNATEQQKNAVKAKNLQQQIREQEKAVKAHRDALEEVRKKYGDNEDAIAKYEQRLNDARTALANMKNQLDAVDKSYDAVTDGAKKGVLENNALADSFGRIGEAAGNISGIIETAFSGMLKIVKSTVGEIWGELMDIAAKSDNYMDLANYFGASATEVQKWDSAMKAAAGDMSTVTGLITKLKYSGKEDKVTEWFHVSAENYTNDLEYFQVVMQQMFDARDQMIKDGTWDKAMADIFGGKKGFDVEGILSDWADIQNGLQRFNADEGGYGLSEDQIEQMAQLNIQVQTLKESWEKLKEMATVHLFGDLAIKITGNLQNILDAFKDYLTADNEYAKKAALDSIKKNIREMFEAIRDAIKAGLEVLDELAEEFENSDDPTEKTIGGLLRGLKNTIEWLADSTHWEDIKKGIEIVFDVWLFTKLAAVAGKVTSIVADLGTISAFRGLGGSGGGGGGGLTSSGSDIGTTVTAGKTTGLWATLKAGGAKLLSALATPVAGTAGAAALFYGITELVNYVNDIAMKDRDVSWDANRFNENFKGVAQDYSYSGINKRAAAERSIGAFMGQTGGQAQENGYSAMKEFAITMGEDLLKIFEYENSTGTHNRLLQMLDQDAQTAAVAGMMLHYAGIDLDEAEHAYQNYLDFMKSGSLGTYGYTALSEYFNQNNWRSGLTGNDEIMPVINGVPLANMSGYLMTNEQNKPKFSNGNLWWGRDDLQNSWGINGTWDPAAHTSDWWRNQGAAENQKIEMSDSSISGLKKAVTDGVAGIRVYMDGELVGHLVAPVVSEDIARGVQ